MADGPEYWFYHLTHGTLEGVLPELLEKTLERGWTARVICPDEARVAHLDAYLWTYRDDSFLPHGREDQAGAEHHPIRLSKAGEKSDPADLHFSLGGTAPEPGPETQRCIIMIEDSDPVGRDAARQIWARLKSGGTEVSYYQQAENGKWVKR